MWELQISWMLHSCLVSENKPAGVYEWSPQRNVLPVKQDKIMEAIPRTQSTLFEHTKYTVYQARLWSTRDLHQPQIPAPEGWRWKMDIDSQYSTPFWTTLPTASKTCGELVKCGCKAVVGCKDKCACKKVMWTCTELCNCIKTWKSLCFFPQTGSVVQFMLLSSIETLAFVQSGNKNLIMFHEEWIT